MIISEPFQDVLCKAKKQDIESGFLTISYKTNSEKALSVRLVEKVLLLASTQFTRFVPNM